MKEIVIHTLIDGLKLIPFLLITFIIMEYIEHKFSKKAKNKITKAGRLGPLIGTLLGAFPQCGFSVMATNLYATRIITMGTLISIYLSTSDEMLPILISKGVEFGTIARIVIIKIIIGMISGFVIDFFINGKEDKTKYDIKDFCKDEHCDCEHGIFKSALRHTINILTFIILVTFILNLCIHTLGVDGVSKLFLKNNFFSPFISSLVGLIPNCGASVILTELYLKSIISLGSAIGGLLTGSGVALLVLFKVNKNLKENLKIVSIVYIVGVVSGIIINLFA